MQGAAGMDLKERPKMSDPVLDAVAVMKQAEQEIIHLREALKEAIGAIQVFHGPGWEIYRDHSPEMKRWRALLGEANER
jgi:hypothetical protein